eukprot:15476834-Alexandrium_andersonii.AAC.1
MFWIRVCARHMCARIAAEAALAASGTRCEGATRGHLLTAASRGAPEGWAPKRRVSMCRRCRPHG